MFMYLVFTRMFMYLVFTRMPGDCYRRRLGSLLLCLCDVFRALINSLCVLILKKTLCALFCFRLTLFSLGRLKKSAVPLIWSLFLCQHCLASSRADNKGAREHSFFGQSIAFEDYCLG